MKNINTRKTNEEFIKEANSVHHNKYEYDLVEYKSNSDKVKIICREHGIFQQTPKSHLNGARCPKCAIIHSNASRYKKEDIVSKLKSKYGDSYEYPDFTFKTMNDKITLICKKHGSITKKIISHLNYGCSRCYHDSGRPFLKSTTEKFIEKSNIVHDNKYDYSLVVYENNKSKVKIICGKHGEFLQAPSNHLVGQGCPKCNSSKGELLIEKFLIKNGIRYYSQFGFNDCRSITMLKFDFYLYDFNICIEFDGVQHYSNDSYYYKEENEIRDKIKNEYCRSNEIKLIRIKYHSMKNINKILTKKLKNEKVLSMEKKKELFIKKSIELWGYKYDYSRVDYVDYRTPVKIGYKGLWYSQTPNKHLMGKKIELTESRMSTDNFIILSKKVWGDDRFDYSECEYLGTSVKVKLFDNLKQKWIEQVPKSHLKGFEVVKITKEDFLEKCNIIHDFKYEYDLDQFTDGLVSRLDIKCGEHGVFNMKAANHIYGKCCPKCDENLFVKKTKKFLDAINISYFQQHIFDHNKMPFDFYIPSMRLCIEFDSKQHYEPIDYFGGVEAYERLKANDKIKDEYCEDNYIDLIRIRYDQIDQIPAILKECLKNRI